MTRFSTVLIGGESLLIGCADMLRERGHRIDAVISTDPAIRDWAAQAGVACHARAGDLNAALPDGTDWILSIANLSIIPDAVLALARQGAVNFHDGPLPDRAGLNTPAWARIEGAATHGITWHVMEGGVDKGDILEQRLFDITPEDTAFTLNSKCYAAAMDSFPALVAQLEDGLRRTPQDLSTRTWYARDKRPEHGGFLEFSKNGTEIAALVRGLDFGDYANPLTRAKIMAPSGPLIVVRAEIAEGSGAPGTVLATGADSVTVACGNGALRLSGLCDMQGHAVEAGADLPVGTAIALPSPDTLSPLSDLVSGENHWRARLIAADPLTPGLARRGTTPDWRATPLDFGPLPNDDRLAVVAQWARMSCGAHAGDLGYVSAGLAAMVAQAGDLIAPMALLHIDDSDLAATRTAMAPQLDRIAKTPGFAADLMRRDPGIDAALPDIAVSHGGPVAGTAVTVALGDVPTFHHDADRVDDAAAALLIARLHHMAVEAAAGRALTALPPAEQDLTLNTWNATGVDHDRTLTVHAAFEAQVARTPDATALVFEDLSLSYGALNAAANRMAHTLRTMGVGPGAHVGLCTARSPDLLIGALAILKAGGAYVPLDPAYPADRIAHYICDSEALVIVAQPDLIDGLPANDAVVLSTDDARIADAPNTKPEGGAGADDLAYLIYTSGSTGLPKGVMVEHRNVANFFTGMDARIDHDAGSVWLAVTSLSFDISVLELFWTLARGFKLILSSDADRALIAGDAPAVSDRPIDFNLFYWGNDDGAGPKKYELLLEGAKFADANGFNAVWTPERHFHAFGGPYPNPSVTGAAVAAVTHNLSVRAGSCVAPLHHPARIAEEWAVIDNLIDGRAGLAIASGWQPDDFVLRPENTPPANKPAMYEAIDILRKLWRGDAVAFPTQDGTMFDVVTQPRPVSAELPIWVTTAGNPETWKEAGAIGANVLTHLLGQSIDEVAGKITLYHDALRAAGHDPADHKVTVMLHTYLADTREAAEQVARGPMKDYLRSAAGLIKQYAWAFPAFKRPAGVSNPFEVDLSGLAEDEMEAILEFAFLRYFEDSGLFGTVDDAVARAEQLKRIGVDEIACLIDYGIAPAIVMEGLKPLAEALRRANAGSMPAEDDFSIAAQIRRHGVTHLQCTPSMARMIAMNDDAGAALARLKTLMVGGEALSGDLVRALKARTDAAILNMYGPTETTIWSTVQTVNDAPDVQPIGTPIANTSVYVLDAARRPAPVGVAGELFIGGEGVTRGYWRRDDLTAERFPDDPFHPDSGARRMYATGDLVRWRADGTLDFLGRMDTQVKIRGHRIELGEIEARLVAIDGIAQAVVIARDMGGDTRLVAYLTGQVPDDATLRTRLEGVLPAIMVPAHFVTLDTLPLTPNRKIDRKALPEPVQRRAMSPANTAAAPVSGRQGAIAAIWSRILSVADIRPDDNFFSLGGHSLLAVQAHREIRADLAVPHLSITDIFRYPVLKSLADHIDGANTERPQAAPEDTKARSETMNKRRAMRANREARTG
ncbi:MupA/Atu3671 family FMN-dependent luciferase-like monooxygenase [Oceaniglobus indicus]|uniref:MupA/Atu3671 family FMN-dependent luciferase-like monooxygenase n=1 Tax=Oceaniglobus indicus TaxID=2047749 RepID=UPI000C184B6C|nr:MupA/Atu3671 family FMN-dependent luciferase-like monooxygenase [Oceaniglobus indicus]